jgi:hypothetical protein
LLQSVHEGRGVASGSPAGAHRPRRGGLGLTHRRQWPELAAKSSMRMKGGPWGSTMLRIHTGS